jgi:hypothetical protein
MVLETDKDGFQNSYYLVGTGMIRMPSHGIVYVADRSCKGAQSSHRPSRPETARRGVGSSGWLVRLAWHVRSLARHDVPEHR